MTSDQASRPRDVVALGITAGWLAAVIAPLSTNNQTELFVDGTLGAARVAFFAALAVAALALLSRRVGSHMQRYNFALCLAALSALVGIANWMLDALGNETPALLVATFALTGIVAMLIQPSWDIDLKAATRKGGPLVITAVALLMYILAQFSPAFVRRPIGSVIPLIVVLLNRPLALRPERQQDSGTLHGDERLPWDYTAAIFLLFVSGHTFNGTAELGAFVQPLTMCLASMLGISLGVAAVTWVARPGAGNECYFFIGCSLIMALSVLIQGVMSLSAVGTELLTGGFGAGLHIAVFASDYALFGLVWMGKPLQNDAMSADAPRDCVIMNLGISGGTLLGMIVGSGAAASFLSLAFSLGGLLLLGMQAGRTSSRPNSQVTSALVDSALLVLSEQHGLSSREEEVLELWTAGHHLDYVAETLCISKNTVKTHVKHIYGKMGVANREELIQLVERAHK